MTSLGIVIDMYVNSSDQLRHEKRTIESLTRNLAISWKRVLLMALLVSVLSAMVHGIIPSDGSSELEPSVIAENGLLPMAYILYGTLWFTLLGLVFVGIQSRMAGSRMVKGLAFGIFYFSLVLVVYFEPLPHSGSILNEMVWMLADGVPFIIFGILLGRFVAIDGAAQPLGGFLGRRGGSMALAALGLIPIVFVAGRLVSYELVGIYSSFGEESIRTLAWALAFGIALAAWYFYFRPALVRSRPICPAAIYGLLLIGLQMLFFNLAFALIVDVTSIPAHDLDPIVDILARTGLDIVSVTLGVLAFEVVLLRVRA